MSQSVVSICMPTYEPDPQLLRQAIGSVLAQTVHDWTLLIHDDCSAENVEEMVKPYLNDPRITFIRSSKRLGIGGNWNETARLAKHAMFTAYLFQDDTWAPQYLERALLALERNPSAGLVAVMHHYEMESLHPLSHHYQAIEAEREHVFRQTFAVGKDFLLKWLDQGLHPNLIGEPSFVVIHTELLKQTPWSRHMVQCLDSDGWARMLQKTDISFVHESSGTFLVHAAGASSHHQKLGKGMTDRLRILTRLYASNDEDIRQAARRAVIRELPKMAVKFMRRVVRF